MLGSWDSSRYQGIGGMGGIKASSLKLERKRGEAGTSHSFYKNARELVLQMATL